MKKIPSFVLSLFLLAISAQAFSADAPATPAPIAAEPDYDAETRAKAARLSRQIMSPFCPGRTISDCTSEHAAEWRREILAMVASGRSADSIVSEFESRAGRDLSGMPERKLSVGLPLFLALSAAIVLVGVFSWLRRERPAEASGSSSKNAPKAGTVSDDRLRAELSELDDE